MVSPEPAEIHRGHQAGQAWARGGLDQGCGNPDYPPSSTESVPLSAAVAFSSMRPAGRYSRGSVPGRALLSLGGTATEEEGEGKGKGGTGTEAICVGMGHGSYSQKPRDPA